jgi:hypothetical protein
VAKLTHICRFGQIWSDLELSYYQICADLVTSKLPYFGQIWAVLGLPNYPICLKYGKGEVPKLGTMEDPKHPNCPNWVKQRDQNPPQFAKICSNQIKWKTQKHPICQNLPKLGKTDDSNPPKFAQNSHFG